MTKIARQAKQSLELIHAMIYFAPEAAEGFTELGLEGTRMSYYASRSAPMGAVSAGVVAATFYNFNPDSVAKSIPRAWTIATPDAILATRLKAADAALRRMLGDDVIASETVAEAAELAREATTACSPDGKPLYAGHADLEWPDEPHLKLWHAITLLREFRGDAHIAALQQAELSGIQALALHSTVAGGFTPEAAKKLREWSDEQWAQAFQQLRDRGLIDADHQITDGGRALREEIETVTDAMSMAPWSALGEAKTEVLIAGGGRLSKALAEAGAIPQGLRR
jgi:hypothetical protein